MRKGILLWTTIALVPALAIVGFSVYMFQGQMDNYVEMNARYQALEISGVINILQASPEETVHEYVPPVCAEIEDNKVMIRDFAYFIELITTPVEIEPGTIGCGEGGEAFAKEDKIRIRIGE